MLQAESLFGIQHVLCTHQATSNLESRIIATIKHHRVVLWLSLGRHQVVCLTRSMTYFSASTETGQMLLHIGCPGGQQARVVWRAAGPPLVHAASPAADMGQQAHVCCQQGQP